jgi:hypothetical protein
MKPEKIIAVVAIHAQANKFKSSEVKNLQRYFVKKLCPWLPLRYIGNLTGIKNHDGVIDSVTRVEKDHIYSDIKWSLMVILKAQIQDA